MAARPLIIDCDPGKDDAVALLLAFAAPAEVEVRLVTAAAGNVGVEHTSTNIRRLCDLAGRPDVAVHAGCPRPILRPLRTVPDIHGLDGLAGAALPPPVAPLAEGHAVPALVEAVARAEGEVTIAGLAPLTNVALALVMAPAIVPKIREIVLMGGSFGPGNITPYASFNIYTDPHAAEIVFTCGAPVTMIGLDVTRRTMPTPAWRTALAASASRAARAVARMWNEPTTFMNDPCVIAYLLRPDLFTIERKCVAIELVDEVQIGRTRLVEDGPPTINVVTDIDVDGFFALLAERLARL